MRRSGRHRAPGTGSAPRTRPAPPASDCRGAPRPPQACRPPTANSRVFTVGLGRSPLLLEADRVPRAKEGKSRGPFGLMPGPTQVTPRPVGPRGWGAALAAGRWGHKRLSRQAMTAAGAGGEGGRSHPPCPWCRFRNVSGYRSGSTKPCAHAACGLVGDRRGAFQRRRRAGGRGRRGHRQRAAPAGGGSSAEAWAFSRGGQEGPGVRRRDRPGRPCCAAGPSWAWGADTRRRLSPLWTAELTTRAALSPGARVTRS